MASLDSVFLLILPSYHSVLEFTDSYHGRHI